MRQSPSPRKRTEKRKRDKDNLYNQESWNELNRLSYEEGVRKNRELLNSELKKTKIPIKNFLYRPRLKTNVSSKVQNLILLKNQLKKDKPRPSRKVNANRKMITKELRRGKRMTNNNYLYIPHKSSPKGTKF